jgi:hypothetical protein
MTVSTQLISLRVPDWYTLPRTWKITVKTGGQVRLSDQTEMNRYLDRTMLDPILHSSHASVLCPPIRHADLRAWLDLSEPVAPRTRSDAIEFANTAAVAPGFGMPLMHNGLTRTIHLPTALFFSVYEFTMVAIIVRVENAQTAQGAQEEAAGARKRGPVAMFGKFDNATVGKLWPIMGRNAEQQHFFLSGIDLRRQQKVLLNGIRDVIVGDVFVDEETHLSYCFDGQVWANTRVATNEARVSGWFYFPKGMPDVGGKQASLRIGISSAQLGSGGGWRWFENQMIQDVFKAARYCISVDIKAMLKSERNLGPAGPLDYTRALWRHKMTSAPSADGSAKLKGIKDCFFCNAPFGLFRSGKPFHARWRAPEESILFNSLVAVYRTYKVATGQALEVDIGVMRSNLNLSSTTQHADFVLRKPRHAALGVTRETDPAVRFSMLRAAVATGLLHLRQRMQERIAAKTVKPADNRYISGPQRKRLLEYGSANHNRPAAKRGAGQIVDDTSACGAGAAAGGAARKVAADDDVFIVQIPDSTWATFWSELVVAMRKV